MTERLYYQDSYLRDFEARVVEIANAGRRVYLDRTAFYPTSGGQSFDLGLLGGVPVEEVVDEGERVAHLLGGPLSSEYQTGSKVHSAIDWARRFDHMQQHTGQHLLSAVLHELFGWVTVSVHLGEQNSTVDVDAAQVGSGQLDQAEHRCAEIVAAFGVDQH